MPLSGSRFSPAYGSRWVDLRLSAFSGFLATASPRTNLGRGLSEKSSYEEDASEEETGDRLGMPKHASSLTRCGLSNLSRNRPSAGDPINVFQSQIYRSANTLAQPFRNSVGR